MIATSSSGLTTMISLIPANKPLGAVGTAVGKTNLGLIKELKTILTEGIEDLFFDRDLMPQLLDCRGLADKDRGAVNPRLFGCRFSILQQFFSDPKLAGQSQR